MELSLCHLGHAPGMGLGVMGIKNLSFWDLKFEMAPIDQGF